jgi:hypothetical protein
MFRKHFNATSVVAVVALVFAMTGGAYAAKHYLITSTKQISPKVLKALRGKTGKIGPAGAIGPQGPQGPAGANGKDGASGVAGKDGTNGVGVTSAEVAKSSSTCSKQGGTEFTSASGKTTACNGKEGSPWTDKGTLPEGSSERGQWIITAPQSSGSFYQYITTISFPIPLAAALPTEHAHSIGVEEGAGEPSEAAAIKSGECTGNWQAPGAASGNLCVFVDPGSTISTLSQIENLESGEEGAGPSGALLGAGVGSTFAFVKGSWVVTG